MNYIRLYEFIFNRVKDPVESLDLLLQLEIPPADPRNVLSDPHRREDQGGGPVCRGGTSIKYFFAYELGA